VLLLGALATAAAMYCLTVPQTYNWTLRAVLGVGLGAAAVSVASMVLMKAAFPARSVAGAINLGCVFMALGALVTPVLVDVLLRVVGYARTVGFLATLCLAPAILAALTPGDQFKLEGGQQQLSLVGLASRPELWIAAAVFFFYAPLEGAIGVWTTSYLKELGEGEHAANWMLSAFWTSFLASRLLVALWNPPSGWTPVLLVVPPLLTAVALGNLTGTGNVSSARFYLVLLGFLLGPVFPTLVAAVFETFANEQGAAYGAVFAFGSLGSLLLAPVMGARAGKRSIQAAFVIPMVVALAMSAAAVVFVLRSMK
jgi:fucose permease